MGKAIRCRRRKSTWTLSHALETGEAIGDGLERLADYIEMVQPFLRPSRKRVVDQIVVEERREPLNC